MFRLFRILLFLHNNQRASWKNDRLHQRDIFKSVEERDSNIGLYPRYPLRGVNLFHKDWFRFIDRNDNIIDNNTIADVNICFDLHGPKAETLFVIPNEHSGGLDFSKGKMVNGQIKGKTYLRWFPLPLPSQFLTQQVNDIQTYLVIQHPDEVCDAADAGQGCPIPTGQFHGDPPPVEPLAPNLFLTGSSISWIENTFTEKNSNSMEIEVNLKSFFRLLSGGLFQ